MKKLVLVLTLGLSTATLFSFKSSTTAREQMQDPGNYQVNEQQFHALMELQQAYQADPDVDLAKCPTSLSALQALLVAQIKMLLGGNCGNSLDEIMACQGAGQTQMPDDEIQLAEQYGIITKL